MGFRVLRGFKLRLVDSCVKVGVRTLKGRILAGYYGFNANILFTFQAIKTLYAHLTYLRFGLSCKCFGDFWVYWTINSFSQRISGIYGKEILKI